MMDFGWTPEQQALREETQRFATEQLVRDLERRDAACQFLEDNWQKCAARGVLGWPFPAAYGGGGFDLVTTVAALDALGYGCPDNGLTLALNGQMWAVQEPLHTFGTEAQKQKYLPKLIDGSLKGAHGMTEPQSGSDAFSLETTAEAVDGGYRINGKKVYIGLGPVADVILTFAVTSPDRGRWGLSTFIVEADTQGVTLGPAQEKMGLRTAPMGEIEFADVFVPAEARLGSEGAGASVFSASMEYERSFIFASHVGSMARQLDETVAFCKARELAGRPISELQTLRNRVADMRVRLETARLFVRQAAWKLDQGQRVPLEAAMAKLVVSEAFTENSIEAIRAHGGKGYLSDCGVDRDLRDALGGVIYSGTSDIQRNLIAALLGM
ncbi:MAG: acyl-CoA dehydrogenase family protein [Planctomycetota bacterium]